MKLAESAAAMRRALAVRQTGWTRLALPRGLDIILQHKAPTWRLAIRRRDTWPSDNEADICRRAFQVADGSEPKRTTRTERGKVPADTIRWHIIEYRWRELDAEGHDLGRLYATGVPTEVRTDQQIWAT